VQACVHTCVTAAALLLLHCHYGDVVAGHHCCYGCWWVLSALPWLPLRACVFLNVLCTCWWLLFVLPWLPLRTCVYLNVLCARWWLLFVLPWLPLHACAQHGQTTCVSKKQCVFNMLVCVFALRVEKHRRIAFALK